MEGDFKRPSRPIDGFGGGRPRPQPSQRPTGPRPAPGTLPHSPGLAPPQLHHHRPANHIPVHHPEPSRPPAEPATTAELIARHEQTYRKDSGGRRNLVLAVSGLVTIVAVVLIFTHRAPAKHTGPFPASISSAQVTIPVYYPKGLPPGFKTSGSKVVKQDVLNYVVTSPNNDNFYVTIEAIPGGYDFAAFNKRFSGPTAYQTAIGTATMGLMNNELVCSIQTAKSWVLINSTATKSNADMATVAKALKPASL